MATDKLELTRQMIDSFGKDMDFFYSNTHNDIVLDFPFAQSNGFPTTVKGIDKVKPHFASVITILEGWRPRDIQVFPFADPDMFLIRYRGTCTGRFGPYEQQYVTMVRYQDDKLVLFREFWDTLQFERAWGDAKEAEAAARETA